MVNVDTDVCNHSQARPLFCFILFCLYVCVKGIVIVASIKAKYKDQADEQRQGNQICLQTFM